MARPWLDVMEIAADPMRFGAPLGLKGQRRDLSADWTLLLQAGIDRLVGHPGGTVMDEARGTLYLPPGIYRITSPLLIRRVDTDDMGARFVQCTLEIMGDTPGPAFAPEGTIRQVGATHASVIYADFRDRPAIIIQFGRSVRLRNLAIQGHNDWITVPGRDPRDMAVHADDANYYDRRPHSVPTRLYVPRPPGDIWGPVDVQEPPPRDLRHTPYAGVCIDPFSMSSGLLSRYPILDEGRNPYTLRSTGSTLLTIEGCHIRGFVTGIVISPGLLANAENILIADTTIESTVSAVAICQNQSRHVVLRDVNIFGAKYAVNCVEYGQGDGDFTSIFGARIAGVRYLFHAFCPGSSYAVKGLVAESIWGIGQLDGDPDFDGCVFDGCHFTFGRLPTTQEAVSGHLLNYTNTVFNECTFAFAPGAPRDPGPIKFCNDSHATLSLNGCVFRSDVTDDPNEPDKISSHTPLWVTESMSMERVSYHGCIIESPQGTLSLSAVHPPQSGVLHLAPPGSFFPTNIRLGLPDNQGFDPAPGGFVEFPSLRWISGIYPRIPLGTVKGYVENRDGTVWLTLDATIVGDALVERVFGNPGDQRILLPGDLVLCEQLPEISLPITTSSAVVLADGFIVVGQIARASLGPMLELILAQVPTAMRRALRRGTPLQLFVSYLPRVHPLTQGTVTHGSNWITDVTSEAALSQGWRKGDRIRGGWIVPGTFVLQVQDSRTLRLSARAWDPNNDQPPDEKNPLTRQTRLFDADVRGVTLR